MSDKLNVLITGVSGYLGGCIALHLNKNRKLNITTCSSSEVECKISKHFKIDWENKKFIKEVCKGQDVIIHCASPNAKETELKPQNAYNFNSSVLDEFIIQAIDSNVKKFIYFSSAHIYNSALTGEINELTPINPKHPYGISKKIAEETLLEYSKFDSFDLNIIRLSNAFGVPCNKKMTPWGLVVNDFCRQAFKTKKININSTFNVYRNFVPLIDVVNLVNFILSKHTKNEPLPTIFNFGGEWNFTLMQLAQKITDEYFYYRGEKIKISVKEYFKNNLFEFNYNFDLIKNYGFVSDTDYSMEIRKIFEILNSE